ncbi:molecular chaperone [Parahypoxylon ruwenzoriense]
MRSARPLRRALCEACKQQQQQQQQQKRYYVIPSFNHAAVPSGTPLSPASCGVRNSNSSINMPQQRRSISRTASLLRPASSPSPSDAPAANTEAGNQGQEPASPTQPSTHYDLFPQTLPLGPPPRGPFAIDVRALRREFLTLQATAHPDLSPGGGAARRRAEALSARINEAYRTLSSPLQRAQYVLWLRGVDVANEETARVEDPGLLTSVLEMRELIEEAEEEEDLEPLRRENEDRIRDSEERLGAMLERDDLPAAREEAQRLRYWVNIRESIHGWEKGKGVTLQH